MNTFAEFYKAQQEVHNHETAPPVLSPAPVVVAQVESIETVNTQKEDYTMDNSSLNATEIAVGSLLAGNRGYGGYGGAWGGGGYGVAPFAGPASNAVRINRNSEMFKLGLDRVSDQNEETRRNLGEARLMDNISGGHDRIQGAITNSEFRAIDRMRDLEREMAANARTAAECCCELKLQACEDKSELKAEIKAVEARTIERELNAAQARITQLETINELAQRCGCNNG